MLLLSAGLYADIVYRYAKPRSYADRVVDTTALNFGAYWQACQGHDEYEPLSNKCDDWIGFGATAIDSLDTLYLMGLSRQYDQVRKWALNLTFKKTIQPGVQEVSVFETVIRVLGGLNSAFAMSNDQVWLSRAQELGDLLLPAFQGRTGCPETFFNPVTRQGHGFRHMPMNSTGTADAGSLQLEFRTLSAYSGNPQYAEAVDRCQRMLIDHIPDNVVVPATFDLLSGRFMGSTQSIGANVDSFIEMLLKTWLAFGKRDDALVNAFEKQVDSILTNLTRFERGTYIVGERESFRHGKPDARMEHLTCFFPGVLALAAKHGLGGGVNGEGEKAYMTWARRLGRTCFNMTRSTPEGLAPEVSYVAVDGSMQPAVEISYLRPEIIESLYVLYEVTNEQIWRRMGELMWDSIEKNAMLESGRLVSMKSLGYTSVQPFGKLHSFVLAETLKYFYLLFSDVKKIDLAEVVFNTEAHPVPIQRRPPGNPMLNG